jgi:hypothetical protein
VAKRVHRGAKRHSHDAGVEPAELTVAWPHSNSSRPLDERFGVFDLEDRLAVRCRKLADIARARLGRCS